MSTTPTFGELSARNEDHALEVCMALNQLMGREPTQGKDGSKRVEVVS